MANQSRREFLKRTSAGALTLGLVACTAPAPAAPPPVMDPPMEPAIEATVTPAPALSVASAIAPVRTEVPPAQRSLIVIQLSGGDDGLNAVVPYGDGLYYQLRPTLGITPEQVLPLTDRIGLNPGLKSFKTLFDQNKLAIIQGVGYPTPNRSHFRSMDIWHTAKPESVADEGWLGSFMAQVSSGKDNPFQCVSIGSSVPRALNHTQVQAAAVQDVATFQFQVDRKSRETRDLTLKTFGEMYPNPGQALPAPRLIADGWGSTSRGVEMLRTAGEKYRPAAQYPAGPFGRALQQIAGMTAANLGTRVFYASIGGWDTHANQRTTHATLLTQLSDGLLALQTDLESMGKADGVLTLGFSEFGRRARENGSAGTDHGAAGPMFLMGTGIKSGLYGDHPRLDDLDNGDLKMGLDFRQVYATVIEDWLGVSASSVLGGSYDRLGFIA